MEQSKLQHKVWQHTIPKCYLRQFSDDRRKKHIFQKEKPSDSSILQEEKHIAVKDATIAENFYTLDWEGEPMIIETLLYDREIENHYPTYYSLLTDASVQGFDMEQRARMMMCLLSLHCRTPRQLEIFMRFANTVFDNDPIKIEKAREEYKVYHAETILVNFIAAHQFKVITIAKLTDTSEFFTSDNPLLIMGADGILKNGSYREQFNIDNDIVIPLDRKHCCILRNATDKNGIDLYGKIFYNRIQRKNVNFSFSQQINLLTYKNADKFCYGSKKYMKAFFRIWNLT
jgi:hypothetical protein